jgi:pimeloyl-ACP methyl ester carboxylesterase
MELVGASRLGQYTMALQRMTDVVILIPGIMGSILQKDERDLWATSWQAACGLLAAGGRSWTHDLLLQNDDPKIEDLGDNVKATGLIPGARLIPGLVKIDGYAEIGNMIAKTFRVKRGTIHDNEPANFIEFPYDWRRDNRVAARQLQAQANRRLQQWRRFSGIHDAKLILIGHSMGGLIARYYLEVLDGWQDCKALITLGTPYRGSVNALDFLANGYKKAFVDLTESLRSFTSIYQLLPIYKMLRVGGATIRIAEADGIPNVVRSRAEAALEFHRAIESAVIEHSKNAGYREHGYKIIPVVGTYQPTLQSAELNDERLTVANELPDGIDDLLADGDGTVPRLSAIPIEMSDEFRDSYFAERHGSLQRNTSVLNDLRARLQQMQVSGLREIRGPEPNFETERRAAISLDLDDFYGPDEQIEFRVRLINTPALSGPPEAVIERVDDFSGPVTKETFRQSDGAWVLEMEKVPAGLYRIAVSTSSSGPGAPSPVHDLFATAG